MNIDVSIFYKGTVKGSVAQRKTFLADRFNEISAVLQQHNVALVPGSLSAAGQTMEASLEQSELAPLKTSLAKTKFQIVPNDPKNVIS